MKKYLLTLAIILSYIISFAQKPLPPIQYKTTGNVNAQDSLGMLWEGQQGGIHWFATIPWIRNHMIFTAGTGIILTGSSFSLNTTYTDNRYFKQAPAITGINDISRYIGDLNTARDARLYINTKDTLTNGYHGFGDYSPIYGNNTAAAYASYDAYPTFNGSTAIAHGIGFQSRPEYQGSISMTQLEGIRSVISNTGTGTVGDGASIHIFNAMGTGPITNAYGLLIDNQTRGVTSTYAIKTGLGLVYFGDNVTSTGTMTGTAIQAILDGSNTVSAGPLIELRNVANTSAMLQQLNASGGLDWWNFNSGWTKRMTLSASGILNLTAPIHLAAGTATALTAPMYFIPGTITTVAETGAVEMNGNDLLYTPASTRRVVMNLDAIQTAINKTFTAPQLNSPLLNTSSTVGYVWTATGTNGAGAWAIPTISGIVPYANGGTNASTSWTAGSIIFAGSTTLSQDNSNFFYDVTNHFLGLGTAIPTHQLTFSNTQGTPLAFYNTSDQTTNYSRLVLQNPASSGNGFWRFLSQGGGTQSAAGLKGFEFNNNSGGLIQLQGGGNSQSSVFNVEGLNGGATGYSGLRLKYTLTGTLASGITNLTNLFLNNATSGTGTSGYKLLWAQSYDGGISGSGSRMLIDVGTNSANTGALGTYTSVFGVTSVGKLTLAGTLATNYISDITNSSSSGSGLIIASASTALAIMDYTHTTVTSNLNADGSALFTGNVQVGNLTSLGYLRMNAGGFSTTIAPNTLSGSVAIYTPLVSGTLAITAQIPTYIRVTLTAGVGTASISTLPSGTPALASINTIGGTVTTTWQYKAVCTAGLVTVTALTSSNTTNTSDASIIDVTLPNSY